MLVLDASILIEIERRNKKTIEKLIELKKKHPQNIAITSAVYAEFLFGFLKIKKEKEVEKYTKNCEMINFDKESATILANLKKYLEQKGETMPIFDLLTASCVIAKNGILVTSDNHFKKVPGLNYVILE